MTEPEQTNQKFSFGDNETDLKEFIDVVWNGKKLIILITAVSFLCSVFYAYSITNQYKSAAVLSLAGAQQQSSPLSGMSGLASLAGISLPGSSTINKGELVIATVETRSFLKHLMTFDNVLASLMAAKTFDTDKRVLIFDHGKYNAKSKTWGREGELPNQSAPSVQQTYKKYLKTVKVGMGRDSLSGFMYISVEHISPIFAKEFLELIISEVNELMRQKDLNESANALEYLKSQLTKTSLLEMQNSINQLIKTQLQKQMMAKIAMTMS